MKFAPCCLRPMVHLLFVLCVSCTPEVQKPNFLLIMTDDHATRAVSAYDGSLNRTPHIDALANRGVLFQNAFVTNSICAPSRAVILTGKYSHINGVRNNRASFDGSQETFPKILRRNGYETAIVGKWHLKSEPTGFDYWNVLPGQGDYYNPDFITMGKDTAYHGYVTDITTDLASNWLSGREGERPFLLMVHHKAPHRNWMPALKYLDEYEGTDFPKPVSFDDNYAGKPHMHDQLLRVADHMDITWDLKIPCDTCAVIEINEGRRKRFSEGLLERFDAAQRAAWEDGYAQEIEAFYTGVDTGEERVDFNYQRYLQDYLRCILSVDDNIGRLTEYLEKRGLSENTVVIYTSDQGFFLGEHGIYDKRYMYEESLRTPLIIDLPGQEHAGSECPARVMNLDLAPTILDIAGLEIPEAMQGQSLLPLLREPGQEGFRDAIYYHFYEEGWGVSAHHGIRTDRYKLIHFTTTPDSWELYDLEADPYEMNNLYADPGYRDLVAMLEQQMQALQAKFRIAE